MVFSFFCVGDGVGVRGGGGVGPVFFFFWGGGWGGGGGGGGVGPELVDFGLLHGVFAQIV